MHNAKSDFPIFSAPQNAGLVYLDNAATTQKPQCVIDAVSAFYATDNANPLRGLYDLSNRATILYEKARHTVAKFINALDCEIIFTRNATESLNLVAYTWGLDNLKVGDEVVTTTMEHHSSMLPWQMVCQKTGAKLVFMEVSPDGTIPSTELQKINPHTKVVAITHVSNVLGCTNDISTISSLAHKVGAVCTIDGAQSTPHIPIDVQTLGADFFSFSGHKMCAPTGIGVLFAKKSLLEKMNPFLRGGEMIEYVHRDTSTWAELPHKFEAGTVNTGGAIGLAAAIDYLSSVGFSNIASTEKHLTKMLFDAIQSIPHVHIIGNSNPAAHMGIATFTIDDVHPHDVASILDTEKIAIRAGHHCTQVLHKSLGLNATCRASVYFYNTEDDISIFVDKLRQVRHWMGVE